MEDTHAYTIRNTTKPPAVKSSGEAETMDVIFLGVNDVGMRIYDWLTDRDGIQVLCMVTHPEQLHLVEELVPDIVVSVGFDHLVPEDILMIPEAGCVNLHPAYLPYNRGKSPNVWSIIEGTPAGVSLHFMDPEFDHGDIIARRQVDTRFDDTGRALHRRLEAAQFDLFTDVWPSIEGGEAEGESQTSREGTYHTTADFEELCQLDSTARHQVKELVDRLRALTFPPFNNAYIDVEGERYFIEVEITHEDDTEGETPEGLLDSY